MGFYHPVTNKIFPRERRKLSKTLKHCSDSYCHHIKTSSNNSNENVTVKTNSCKELTHIMDHMSFNNNHNNNNNNNNNNNKVNNVTCNDIAPSHQGLH